MPINRLAAHAHELRAHGVRSVKPFCYVEDKASDARAALREDNLLVVGAEVIRSAVSDMAIVTEVCGCAWTDHGECVLLDGRDRTDRDATYGLMARMALLHAHAGVDIVGPAAVLDGSVHAIRSALDNAGFPDVGITPSVIFDSVLFAPYKQTMNTDPGRGNRRGFQLDACHAGQALDLAHRWLDEGADSLLVQPAMMSIDILTQLGSQVRVPITAFSVSGEDLLFRGSPDALCWAVTLGSSSSPTTPSSGSPLTTVQGLI